MGNSIIWSIVQCRSYREYYVFISVPVETLHLQNVRYLLFEDLNLQITRTKYLFRILLLMESTIHNITFFKIKMTGVIYSDIERTGYIQTYGTTNGCRQFFSSSTSEPPVQQAKYLQFFNSNPS